MSGKRRQREERGQAHFALKRFEENKMGENSRKGIKEAEKNNILKRMRINTVRYLLCTERRERKTREAQRLSLW